MADQNLIITISLFSNTVIKLDNSNFFIWKSQIVLVIKGHRFIKFLQFSSYDDFYSNQSGKSTSETFDNSSNKYQNREDWEIPDQFFVGWLKGTIVKEVIGHFVDKDATHDLWSAIINRYIAPSPSIILHYRQLLQTTKKHGLSVDAYLLKMKDLARKLTAARSLMRRSWIM